MAGPRPRFTLGTVLRALILPLGWGLYTIIRSPFISYRKDGVTKHWWPYHFIDIDDLGYGKALLNMLGIAALLLLVGGMFLLLDRVLPAKPVA
jgi:hypothetical protein